ncbi:immunoglobulin superfamily DCC subclass member 3-like [Choloepus didactylus]|uniref:immunoglobulin superfamily DCC subclass member 3-like n=1 Tax=Choloepus didactylus TaxID=27675 RepID=UPI00189D4CD0|nr:immunoglobulin superfamily DCC subclass member 3-like [Choloepus didactylus]
MSSQTWSLPPPTPSTWHAYSAEGTSQDSAPIHTSTMGSTPAALGFSTKVLNATSIQASWELPTQLEPIQGFKLFHRKLPAAHFEGPLLLASSVSSFLCTDPESKAGCSCSQDESSSLPGVVVGVHVGLAALIVCLPASS